MESTTDPTFACPHCGRRFPWRATQAGKTARCPCGIRLQIPSTKPQRFDVVGNQNVFTPTPKPQRTIDLATSTQPAPVPVLTIAESFSQLDPNSAPDVYQPTQPPLEQFRPEAARFSVLGPGSRPTYYYRWISGFVSLILAGTVIILRFAVLASRISALPAGTFRNTGVPLNAQNSQAFHAISRDQAIGEYIMTHHASFQEGKRWALAQQFNPSAGPTKALIDAMYQAGATEVYIDPKGVDAAIMGDGQAQALKAPSGKPSAGSIIVVLPSDPAARGICAQAAATYTGNISGEAVQPADSLQSRYLIIPMKPLRH